MQVTDAIELVNKNLKYEVWVRERIIDNLIQDDVDCESCPFTKNGFGCPAVERNKTCVQIHVEHFKNEHRRKFKDPEPITPLRKDWQQVALWTIVDEFLNSDTACESCPARRACALDHQRLNWDRADANIRSDYCHYRLYHWAVKHIWEDIDSDKAKRRMELFAPELAALARESVSKKRKRRAENDNRNDLPE